jgi:flagellar motor switch protein FliG
MAELSRIDVEKIVKNEIEKFVNKEIQTEMDKYLKDVKGKKAVGDIVRKALEDLYKTLWIRRSVWTSEIGK